MPAHATPTGTVPTGLRPEAVPTAVPAKATPVRAATTEGPVDLPDPARAFVVCGGTPLAYRLVHQLVTQYDARVTAIVGTERTIWSDKIRQTAEVTVVEAERLDADAFARAGLADADAVALVDQEDAGNVDAALLAQETNPQLRIVIRMFNVRLGEQISTLLNNCAVLSPAAIAAPAFVAAALNDTASAPIKVADRTLVAVARESTPPEDIVCGLAITGPRGSQQQPETLPIDGDDRTNLVLARVRPVVGAWAPDTQHSSPQRPPRSRPLPRQQRLRILTTVVGSVRLRFVLGAFVALYLAGTVGISLTQDQGGWLDGAYTALVAFLSGNLPNDPPAAERVVLTVLTLASVVLIPALTATVVDAVVRARLKLASGGLVGPVTDHVVVVGLGEVGTRIVREIHDEGVTVVAIERDPQARGIQLARELGIPLIIGDAGHAETLQAASVDGCRALVVASTDDVTNLEVALLGQASNPNVRVVLRLFDGEFANRVKRSFGINISRSVSYLAAPAFAAAMLGRQVIATIPVRRRVLLIAELPVEAGSLLEQAAASAVSRAHEVRLLAIRTSDQRQVLWRPSDRRPLKRTEHLIVVATRAGLSRLLAETATPGTAPDPPPYRLPPYGGQQPLLVPGAQPPSAEGTAWDPPFRPADAPSTRTA